MSEKYTPSDDERKLITFVEDRFTIARDQWISNQKWKFDLYYKNSMDYNWDRQALLDQQNKWDWASNTFVPVTSGYLRGILPKVTDSSPEIRVTWRNSDDMWSAEKVQMLLEYIWDKNNMEQELRKFNMQAIRYWTAIAKVYWKTKTIKTTKDVVDDENLEIKQTTDVKDEFNDPTFETLDIYNFYPDPQWYDIDSCRYVFQRYLMTKEQIYKTYWKDNLQNTEYIKAWTWDLTIYTWVRDTVNNTKNKWNVPKATNEQIEVIEYWEDDKIVVLAWWVLIRNEENPFPFKKKPFLKVTYEDTEFQFYWVWVAEQLAQPQELINKIRNQRIDNVTMSLQQMFVVNDMALVNKKDLDFRPWWLIRVRWQDMWNVIQPMAMPWVAWTAYNEDDLVLQSARQATWLDMYSIWQSEAASTSASAVIASKEASALRIKWYIRALETDVYEPLIRMWLELAKEFYPNDVAENIYGENWEVVWTKQKMPLDVPKKENWSISFEDLSKDDLWWYYNFRVLSDSWVAASKELAKANSLQLLDRAASIWTNPQTWEQYVDIKALWESTLIDHNKDPEKLMWFNSQQAGDRQQQWMDQTALQNEMSMAQQVQWQWWANGNAISNQVNSNLWWSNAPSLTNNVWPNQI